eukprot:1465715-Pyramimonas_sp.AAC.1
MHLAKFVKEGDQLCRDMKKVMLKFNGKPAPTLKHKRYFDVGQPRGRHQGNFEARPCELRKAYDRIHDATYQKKAYLDHKQYCINVMAVMSMHVKACERPLTG